MKKTVATGLILVLALGGLLAACGSSGGDKTSSAGSGKVTVSGDFGKKPKIAIESPLKIAKTTSYDSIKGDGDTLGDTDVFTIQISIADAKSGKTVVSTYDSGQQPFSSTAKKGDLFPALVKALVGQKVGSRVVVEAAPADAYGDQGNQQLGIAAGSSVVMVADLTKVSSLLTGPKGKKVAAPATAPKLIEKGGVPTGFDFGSLPKPTKASTTTLIEGSGPMITSGSSATFNYLGSVFGSTKVFDASYPKGEPFTTAIGGGAVIKCWDQGLAGVRVGSRVLLTCPPAVAYGPQGSPPAIPKNATLEFVVDVLGVS